MRRIEAIKKLNPFRVFTDEDRAKMRVHFDEENLYTDNSGERICSLLGCLYEELEGRPELQDIVLKCGWMARRMNDSRKSQDDMWNE